jgi:putative CocE/NonD family hydrolase
MDGMEIEFDVAAKMRDGTILRADVYRPTSGGPWPVLLHRTPYGRRAPMLVLDPFLVVSRGYMMVHQDTRGRLGSDGEWLPFTYEVDDGYDTVRWAASLPGCTGVVGMIGGSYTGNTQWAAAVAAPPELRAIVPMVTWCDPADGLHFRGGAIELGVNAPWALQTGAGHIGKHAAEDPAAAGARLAALVGDYDGLASRSYWELPSGDLPAIARAGVPDLGTQRALVDPTTADGATIAGKHELVEAAAFNVGGWYDIFLQGSIDNHLAMTQAGKASRLLIGPWTHMSVSGIPMPELNYGMAASPLTIDLAASLGQLQLDWFDRWTKGIESGDVAPVKIFVMGANVWREESEWPLARAVDTPWHLRADGRLTTDAPAAQESPDSYVYDPADPVPTVGGHLVMASEFPGGSRDQAAVETRSDVLVYNSDPLAEDLEVTGRVTVKLHAATDAPSTDWVVRLCDVDTEGVSRNICDGILRVHATPGEPQEHEIDLWSTSNVFLTGHLLRVHVTSSSFPRWDRNLNTGEPARTGTAMTSASQTIYHDSARPSRIVLPVVLREK